MIVNKIREIVIARSVTMANWAFRFSAPKKKVKEIVLNPPKIKMNHSKGSIPVRESMSLCLRSSCSKFNFRTDSSKKDCSVEFAGR